MEGAWSSEKTAFSKRPIESVAARNASARRAPIERMECRIPIIARREGVSAWQASFDLPPAMLALPLGDQYLVLAAIEESVAELLRLHAEPEQRAEARQGPKPVQELESKPEQPNNLHRVDTSPRWLRLACSLWISSGFNGATQCSVNFEWPEMWIDFSSSTRALVLDGIDRTLADIRFNLDSPAGS